MGDRVPTHKRGDPWFDDGNVIILAQDSSVAFKVHRDFLARHSEVFRSMFELPQPSSDSPDVEILDGCQVVRMYDSPIELSNLIKALYDGTELSARQVSLDDFLYTVGILRLATKYFIHRLRAQAIHYLDHTWSHTLRGHDEMIELAIKAPLHDGKSYPYIHPLHVISLARSNNVQIILPSVFYFLSFYPLSGLLQRDHPKLSIDHPSCPSSELSPQDLQAYTLMYQARIDAILDFIRVTCGNRATPAGCQNPGTCLKVFTRVSSQLSRTWRIRTGPLAYMVQVSEEISESPEVCGPCRRAFRQDVTAARENLWNKLPTIIGLPSWEELKATDLPKP